jgi:hypothetical protein
MTYSSGRIVISQASAVGRAELIGEVAKCDSKSTKSRIEWGRPTIKSGEADQLISRLNFQIREPAELEERDGSSGRP